MKTILKIDEKFKTKENLIFPHVIITVNKFDETATKTFRKEMSDALLTGQPVVPVIIDSFGGEVYSLLSMINEIENSPIPVATIGTGKCMSAGAALLAAGTPGYRFIDKYTNIMIHGMSYSVGGKQHEVKSRADHAEELQEQIINILNEKCNKPKGFFQNILDKNKNADFFLFPKDSKKHNIVDHIGTPFFETEITINTQFKWK